jgi:hypothetical protein
MLWSRFVGLLLLFAFTVPAAFAAKLKPCVTADDASKMLKKDICISTHIYDVVEVSDGTRFLDVCSPSIPDEQCQFTIISPAQNRDTVGELTKYRNRNVEIRGTVQPMHGRSGIVLSHARQFSGGPPRFTPNPLLTRGFSAEQSRPPVSDPNLRRQGARRAFMNTRVQEPLPPASK